jgi:hypothetical protein
MHNQLTEPPDPTRRRCYDCRHMKAAVTWWCTNETAAKAHGTHIPGRRDCPFWEPGTWPPSTGREPVSDAVFVLVVVLAVVVGTLVLGALSTSGTTPEDAPSIERSP